MRRILICAVLALASSEAMGACVCVIKVMYRYSNGAAICFAARYEDGECVAGHCSGASDVWEYRLEPYTRREDCPRCRQYTTTRTLTADAGGDCCAPGETAPPAHGAGSAATGPAPVPVELPVGPDFDPGRSRSLEGAHAERIGAFTLSTVNKVASDFSSQSCLRVGRDIHVLAFRVRYRGDQQSKIIAYELREPVPGSRIVPASSISAVRFEPQVGNWLLRMRVSHCDLPEFRGRQVFVFQAPPAPAPAGPPSDAPAEAPAAPAVAPPVAPPAAAPPR